MGCGGSRADAIEPRYYESWTRETESTWLTNTDADAQAPPPPPPHLAAGPESGHAEAGLMRSPPGILEDNKSTQTCIAKSSATSGTAAVEKRTHCGTHCTKQTVNTTGTSAQKQHNGFQTTEAKWDKKKAKKEVPVNATKTIRQLNSNRRMTKNCVN